MPAFITCIAEVLASAWLVIVSVQFIISYFLPEIGVDFQTAYLAMLTLSALALSARLAVFWRRSR